MTSFWLFVSCIFIAILQHSIAFNAKLAPKWPLTRNLQMNNDLYFLHDSLFNKVGDQLGLKLTDFSDYQEVSNWSSGGYNGKIDWFDEKLGSKLTGVSKYSYQASDGSTAASLNGWMGPSLLVPNMILSVGFDALDNSFSITTDYIVRGALPVGSDLNYIETYYNDAIVQDSYDSVVSRAAGFMAPPISFAGRLLCSPLYLSVGGLTLQDVNVAANNHVDRWLSWLDSAPKTEARQRGAINTRDDKIRQFAFQAAVAEYKAFLGDDPKLINIAAASIGPVSEAYIGGGS